MYRYGSSTKQNGFRANRPLSDAEIGHYAPSVMADEATAEVPEIILVNSHDGSSSYQLLSGFFRFVCSNGCPPNYKLIPYLVQGICRNWVWLTGDK